MAIQSKHAGQDAPQYKQERKWTGNGSSLALPAFFARAMQRGGGAQEERLVFLERELIVLAGVDDEVVASRGSPASFGPPGVAREVVLREAEGLAEVALEAVARGGRADGAADGEAEAWVREVGRARVDDERPGVVAEFLREDTGELTRVGEAHAAREGGAGGRGRGGHGEA